MFLEWPTQSPDLNSPVEGIEALSCQVAGIYRVYERKVDQNPSWGVCKPGDKLEQMSSRLCLPTMVSPPRTKSRFPCVSNTYFSWWHANQNFYFYVMFCPDLVSLYFIEITRKMRDYSERNARYLSWLAKLVNGKLYNSGCWSLAEITGLLVSSSMVSCWERALQMQCLCWECWHRNIEESEGVRMWLCGCSMWLGTKCGSVVRPEW